MHQETGQVYYWNETTSECLHAVPLLLRASAHWLLLLSWAPAEGNTPIYASAFRQSQKRCCGWRADETTALGEPRPGPEGRVAQQNALPRMNQGTSLLGLVGMGAGVGLVFAILGRIF